MLHVNPSWWFPEDEDLVALRVAVGGGWRRRVRVPIGAEKVTTIWSRKHVGENHTMHPHAANLNKTAFTHIHSRWMFQMSSRF